MARAATAAKSKARAAASPWIVDQRYDRLFLWTAWCLPFLLWAISLSLPYPRGLIVALVIFALLDNSHQVATLPLTVFDPATMRRQWAVYLGGALAIGGAAVAISFYPGTLVAQIWTSLVVYWGAWHIIRQHYGFLRLYQARDKPEDPRLAQAEVWALYSGASFPYFLNLSQGWAAAEGIGATLYRLPVPSWSPWLVLAIFAVTMGYVLVDALRNASARKRKVSVRLLHLVLVVSNFWIGLLWAGRSDILLAVLFITSYHDLQYHAVVWYVGRKRAGAESEPVLASVRRVFGSLGIFVAAVLGGAVVQGLLRNEFGLASSVLPEGQLSVALFALVTSYSYMHYFFDGKMWKLSRDPRLRAELGLGSGTAN